MNELKSIRMSKNITQKEAADRMGVSLRSYISYENDDKKVDSVKYRFFVSEMEKINLIDENHGVLKKEDIETICADVFKDYKVDYCYLFGSYAKDKASETSDVDLLISTKIKGLKFYELVEKLRQKLCKKVDLLDVKQLVNNEKLLNEILKEGIKIYG